MQEIGNRTKKMKANNDRQSCKKAITKKMMVHLVQPISQKTGYKNLKQK